MSDKFMNWLKKWALDMIQFYTILAGLMAALSNAFPPLRDWIDEFIIQFGRYPTLAVFIVILGPLCVYMIWRWGNKCANSIRSMIAK